ncbi:MAG: hypothetical protein EXR51_09630 [Dehalococcoidia bacterium]|nr:hypothetical protein [Dehalococcoidia bacterium]
MTGAEILDPPPSPATAVREAIAATLRDHPAVVADWLRGTPKTWGFLAGRAVGSARRLLARDLSDAERRQVWSGLWQELESLARTARR